MTKLQIRCDLCGKLKGDANHWFRASKISLYPLSIGRAVSDEARREEESMPVDLCGEQCVQKWVGSWLEFTSGRKPNAQIA